MWECQRVDCTDLMPPVARGVVLPRSCGRCVNDAGFQSGMAGAARCPLIERAEGHGLAAPDFPAEWRWEPNGVLSCSAFEADATDE
jgi:hypothetical protein